MSSNFTSVAEKIAKIIAKAQSTDQAGEAEVLMAKAEQLLQAHNLTMADVDEAQRVTEDPMGKDSGEVSHSWECRLFGVVAQLYGCQIVYWNGGRGKTRISVVGRLSGRTTVKLMWPYILGEVRKKALAHSKVTGQSGSTSRRRVAEALRYRIWELIREARSADEVRVAQGGSTALVPVSEVESAVAEYHGKVGKGRGAQVGTDAVAVGLAKDISLHRQTTGASSSRQLS